MARGSSDTRLDLLRAAERLFAERGVDAVSLREVAAAAGQGNNSASSYHFGTKHNLINCLLERHSDPIQAGWVVALDGLRFERVHTLERVLALMVEPLVAKLDDPDGGRAYLLIVAQLVNSVTFPILEMPATTAAGIQVLTMSIVQNLEPIALDLFPLRMMGVTALLYGSIVAYDRLIRAGMVIPREAFIADLVASMAGLLRGS